MVLIHLASISFNSVKYLIKSMGNASNASLISFKPGNNSLILVMILLSVRVAPTLPPLVTLLLLLVLVV